MEIFYKTFQVTIEDGCKLLDFIQNTLKEKGIESAVIPFTEKNVTSQYNAALKTSTSSVSYEDKTLIKSYKSDNKPFSDEEKEYVDVISNFIENEEYKSKEDKFVKIINNVEKFNTFDYKEEAIKDWFFYCIFWILLALISAYVSMSFNADKMELISYMRQYIEKWLYTEYLIFTIFLWLSLISFIGGLYYLFLWKTVYSREDLWMLKLKDKLLKDYINF